MPRRKRTTWAEKGRRASAPPATPGYSTYFQDDPHPAAYQDPDAEDYMNGSPSAWAEDVHPGPYQTSPAPNTPGYHQEDGKAHPADDRDGRNLRASEIERNAIKKAEKCVRIATATLGRRASEDQIEERAFQLMDLPDRKLDATLSTLSRVAMDDDMMYGFEDDFMDDGMVDDFDDDFGVDDDFDDDFGVDDDFDDEMEMFAGDDEDMDVMGISGVPLLGMEEDEDEDVMATSQWGMGHFASLGGDDGFITENDWAGKKSVFAALDEDGDGIITRQEVLSGLGIGVQASEEDGIYSGLDDEHRQMLAAMLAEAADDEGDDDDDDDDEGDDDKDEKDEKDSDKEASVDLAREYGLIETEFDPMGITAAEADDEEARILASLYGKSASDDEDEDDEGDGEEDEKEGTSKKASLKPQPRKSSKGLKSLGNLQRTAGSSDEIQILSQLWKTEEDVSDLF